MKRFVVVFVIVVVVIIYIYSQYYQKSSSLIPEKNSIESCLEKSYGEIPTDKSYQIKLKSRTFIPKENRKEAAKCLTYTSNNRSYYLYIQLYDVPNTKLKEELNANGIKLNNYLPENTWFAEIKGNQPNLPEEVRWIGTIEPKDKIPVELWNGKIGSWALDRNDALLAVKSHDSVPTELIESILRNSGAEVLDKNVSFNSYTIKIDKTKINELAKINELRYIDTIPPPPTTNAE